LKFAEEWMTYWLNFCLKWGISLCSGSLGLMAEKRSIFAQFKIVHDYVDFLLAFLENPERTWLDCAPFVQ